MSLTPLVFVVGPSGVGKDDVCSWIKTRYNFHHVDIDQPRHFEANGLKYEWNKFKKLDPRPLAFALRNKALAASAAGVVLSLPSDRVIMHEQLEAAELVGIYTIVLWGSAEVCKAARKRRDGSVKHTYDDKNRKAIAAYSAPDCAHARLEVFGPDSNHLPREQVRTLIRARLASCYESPHGCSRVF